MTNYSRILFAGCAAAGILAQPAYAQVEDIIVTAQKREEKLQDVPISITAVTSAQLEQSGVTKVEDLTFSASGLNMTRTTEATVINIRGIGTAGGSTGQDSAVATFIDGVYIPSMAGSTMSLNNVERVEVLKGPQGTLYGRNATGGAVNVITKDPSQTFTFNGDIAYGNRDTVEASLYMSAPVADVLATDLAVFYHNQGKGFGFNSVINNDVNKGKDFAIRNKWLLEIGDNTRVTVAGDYARTQGDLAVTYRAIPSSILIDGTVGRRPGEGWWDSSQNLQGEIDTKRWGVFGKIQHDMGDFSVTSITAYRGAKGFQNPDVDATALPIINPNLFSRERQFTQELQLNYDREGFNAVLGGFFLSSNSAYDPFLISGLGFAGIGAAYIPDTDPNRVANKDYPVELGTHLFLRAVQKTKSYAIFGQATVAVTDTTNVTVGGRYTRDEREYDALRGLQNVGLVGNFVTQDDVHESKTFSKPTWRFAVDQKLGPDAMLYASYSRGFKSGVYNLTNPVQPVVKPETLDAFELGVKTDLLDRRLRLNVAGFYYKYKNIQLFQVNGTETVLGNAAKAKLYGVDVDVVAAFGGGLTLTSGFEWLHHRYGAGSVGDITTGLGGIPPAGSISGNRLLNTPDVTFNALLAHRADIGGGKLDTSLAYSYNDGFYWQVDNRVRQKSFHLVNGQIKWTAPSDFWYLRAFGRNLLNEKYLAQVSQTSTGDIGVPAVGRIYGIGAGLKF